MARRNGSPTSASDGRIAFQFARRPRHEIEGRLHLQLAELIRRKRVDRGFQLHIRFDIGLQPETRRPLPAIPQSYRQRVAGAQVAAPDANKKRVRKRADIEPVEPHFKPGAVARFHRREVCRLWLVELRLAHVGSGPPRNLDHAGVVDAEGACGINQRQLGVRARDEGPAGASAIVPIRSGR